MLAPPDLLADLHWPAKFSEIPKDVFHREDVYARELERIFYGPQWHPVAHVAEIPNCGDFKTAQIGEALVLIVHGEDDRIRVFENACPHRGTQLQTCASGTLERIECPYHRWQFDIAGNLLGAPGSDQFPPDFRKADYGLRALRSEALRGLIFATFDKAAPPLREYLGDADAFLGKAFGEEPLVLLGYQKVIYTTNWKAYADNEGYHAPLLHRAFRLLGWQGGKGVQSVTAYGHKLHDAELRLPKTSFLKDSSLLDFRDDRRPQRSIIVLLFPLVAAIRHVDTINLRYAYPRGPHETEVHYAYFGLASDDAAMANHRVRQSSNLTGPSGLVSLEDGAVFNRIQRASRVPGTVEFQKGVTGPLHGPCLVDQNGENGNLARWEHYREIMGFARS